MTTSQIKAGYAALKKIESCIESNDFGKTLVAAVNDYYTRIPHCFGSVISSPFTVVHSFLKLAILFSRRLHEC
jgi:hypothetical protein